MNHVHTFKDFLPLLMIISCVVLATIIIQMISGNPWKIDTTMRYFMASFFIIFSFFKIIHLEGFREAYAMYDLVAARFFLYGYFYPFIELALGVAYLMNIAPLLVNGVTFFLMIISAAGVLNELLQGKRIMCACLGTVFQIPMTYVTLAEDLVMAIMSALMFVLNR